MPKELTFGLVLLLFPGIICALLVENLTPTREWGALRFSLYSLVLGLGCYLVYALGLAAWHCHWPPTISFVKALSNPNDVSYGEIASVTVVAAFVGIGVSAALYRHWLHRMAKFLGISDKFGDMDVWAHTFNSSDLTNAWVVVRDINHDLAYEGWVNAFSETADANELLLREVKVYKNTTAEFLYEVESLYISRKREELTIEFRRGLQSDNKGASDEE